MMYSLYSAFMQLTNERKTYIYRLLDPRDRQVKYIGKTVNLAWRGKSHRSPYGESHCARWLRCLRKLGLHAEMEIIETVEAGGDWAARERHWIAYYRSQGVDLCNMSAGGEGVEGPRGFSEATREKLRQRFKGRPISEEQKARISATLLGHKQPESQVQKRANTIRERRAAKGTPLYSSAEAKRARRRAAGHPEKFSSAWKAKIAETLRNRFAMLPPEEQERMREQGRNARRAD